MGASVRRIGIAIFAMGLLGGAAILAGNLFPDQAYAVLQNVRAWIGTPATGVAENSPAPQGTPIAQSVEKGIMLPTDELHAQHRVRVFSGWAEMVRGAERNYKDKHGHYGDLAALRKADLLSRLAFQSCSSVRASEAKTNFVPKSTLIDVLQTPNAQSFAVMITEHSGRCFGPPMYQLMPDLKDSSEGLIFPG